LQTANSGAGAEQHSVVSLQMVPNDALDPVLRATEEAIVNAMVAARDMVGVDDHRVTAIPHAELRAVLRKYGRPLE
jgi:D-aminopeptidase